MLVYVLQYELYHVFTFLHYCVNIVQIFSILIYCNTVSKNPIKNACITVELLLD